MTTNCSVSPVTSYAIIRRLRVLASFGLLGCVLAGSTLGWPVFGLDLDAIRVTGGIAGVAVGLCLWRRDTVAHNCIFENHPAQDAAWRALVIALRGTEWCVMPVTHGDEATGEICVTWLRVAVAELAPQLIVNFSDDGFSLNLGGNQPPVLSGLSEKDLVSCLAALCNKSFGEDCVEAARLAAQEAVVAVMRNCIRETAAALDRGASSSSNCLVG